jgi:hypothetical protein
MNEFDTVIQNAVKRTLRDTLQSLVTALSEPKATPVKRAAPKPKAARKAKAVKAKNDWPITFAVENNDEPPVVESKPSNGGGDKVDELRVQRCIEAQPGQRTEQIANALAVPTKAVGAMVKRLVVGGVVRAEGKARGTMYFPVGA